MSASYQESYRYVCVCVRCLLPLILLHLHFSVSLSVPTSRHRCRIPCLPGSCYEVLISFTVCSCGKGYVLNVVALYITVLVGERKKGHWGLWMSLTGWLQMQSHNALSCWHEGCVTANKVLIKQKDGQAPWQYHGMIGWHIKTKC